MASERDEAKASIGDESDLDISGPMDAADRLKHLVENNSHQREMAAGERGMLGTLLGGSEQAPTIIAFIALLLGLGIGFWCLYQGTLQAGEHDFWAKQSERAFTFATSALGFLFGRGTRA